eukprot:5796759-Alexandrium_andersonii.AAC.1
MCARKPRPVFAAEQVQPRGLKGPTPGFSAERSEAGAAITRNNEDAGNRRWGHQPQAAASP